MPTYRSAPVDREVPLLVCALTGIFLVSGDLLPSGLQTLTSLFVGAVFLGAGSALGHAVLRNGNPERRAVLGAAFGFALATLVLLADLLT